VGGEGGRGSANRGRPTIYGADKVNKEKEIPFKGLKEDKGAEVAGKETKREAGACRPKGGSSTAKMGKGGLLGKNRSESPMAE